MRKWRGMTWAIILWTGFFVFWVVSGMSAVSSSNTCAGDQYCEAGTALGAAVGLTMIGSIWFFGFIVLSIIWFMRRAR